MKKFIASIVIGLTSFTLFSQVFVPGHIIRLRSVNDDGEIVLDDLNIKVQVTGKIAETTLDMIFTNTSTRILEGEFEFPLAEGQSVVGYALDINGKLREGVVVEKDKGRQVFEAVVTREVDPGLIEVTKGNNYKTRIYPFEPKGSRHVQITYEEEVTDKYYMAPLCDKPVKNFSFEMKIFNPSEKKTSSTLNLGNWNKGYNINYNEKNFTFDKPIQIDFPEETKKNGIFVTTSGVNSYFYYFDNLKTDTIAKKQINNLAVFFDISNSAKNRNIEKEINFLLKYIEQNVTDKGKIEIIPFNNFWQDKFICNKKNAVDIKKTIKKYVFDGGTCFDMVNEEYCTNKPDEVLVFSDGIVNWGNRKNQIFPVCVNTICSSNSSDFNFLKGFAYDNKGQFINLVNLSEDEAVKVLMQEPYRLLSVKYDSSEISDVYPKEGTIVGSNFSISGKLIKKEGKVELEFGYGDKVTQTVSFTADATESNDEIKNLSRIWAEKKIEALSVNYDRNRSEILKIAKQFKVVTNDTSLIVLDSINDYVRYEIIPPAELLEEYNTIINNSVKLIDNEFGDIPESVIRNFESFRKWWETTPEEFKKQAEKQKGKRALPRSVINRREERIANNDTVMEERTATASARASDVMSDAKWEEDVPNEFRQSQESSEKKSIIQLQAWEPNAEYLTILKKTKKDKMYDTYLELKKNYEESPSFYMEVGDYFNSEGLYAQAITIISNLAELKLENIDILRAMGNKLIEWKLPDLASYVFEDLTIHRPEIPQFFRDLALAYNDNCEYQNAVDVLYYVASKPWDSKYNEIQQVVLNDMNAIIAAHPKEIDITGYDPRILQNFPVDIRIILTWNTDNCDIDLWTFDPNDEKCFYSHKLTEIGGHNSRDFTQGYGPEEFCLRKAIPGEYKIYADYYGTSSQKLLQPVVVQAEVYTDFGTSKQKKQILTLQLETIKGNYLVGSITIK